MSFDCVDRFAINFLQDDGIFLGPNFGLMTQSA